MPSLVEIAQLVLERKGLQMSATVNQAPWHNLRIFSNLHILLLRVRSVSLVRGVQHSISNAPL